MESMSLNFDEIKYLSPDFVIPEDKKLKGNSIFICMSNGSKQHVGKVAFVENDMDYAFGGFMGLITPSKEVSAKYVYYACRSPLYRVFLTSIGNGIGITNLKFTDLYNFSFPMPKLSHQQQIVSELDLLSGVIEKQKTQLEELDKLAQSIFYDMFGDPVTNETQIRFPLGELIDNIKYGTSTPPSLSLSGFKFIRATNIKNGGIVEENMMFIDGGEASRLEKCKLTNKDLIIVRSGVNAGDVCRIGNEYAGQYAGYDIIITANTEKINTIYLNTVLNNPDYIDLIIKPMTRRAAQPHLNAQQVKSMPIPLPPLSLQQEFAVKIEAIEAMKAKVRQSLKEAETLFNSRMDYYFN